jgi:hypothetical protein
MIDLNHVSHFEMQFTPPALSGLLLQELAFDTTQEVVFAESLTPIDEISVVWAGRSFDFDMPLNMGLRVIPQGDLLVSEHPALAVIHMPVFVRYPAFAFVWVPVSCPLLELQKQDIFTVIEDLCCGHRAVIPRPSPNFRIQLANELALRPVAMAVDHLSEFCEMSFHCLFTGSNECLEAKRRAVMTGFSGVGLSHWVLPYRPAQEVKSYHALVFPKRVRDARFAWFQFEANVTQPRFKHLFGFLHPCFCRMEHHKIIRIADEVGLSFSVGKGLRDAGLHAVQRDVGEQWGDHASYNVAKKVLAFVYQVAIPRSHLRATYGGGFQGAPLRCTKRQEEGSFPRGLGVCDEQAFSQEKQGSGGADHV